MFTAGGDEPTTAPLPHSRGTVSLLRSIYPSAAFSAMHTQAVQARVVRVAPVAENLDLDYLELDAQWPGFGSAFRKGWARHN